MNGDERTPEQRGFGQQNDQRDPQANRDQNAPSMDSQGQSSSGQASYGNSGETDTLSQQDSDLGQESDMGERETSQAGSDSRLFQGSDEDTGGTRGDRFSQSPEGGASQSPMASEGQDFADQGQGAPSNSGTADIETERSQGREDDIEGSSL